MTQCKVQKKIKKCTATQLSERKVFSWPLLRMMIMNFKKLLSTYSSIYLFLTTTLLLFCKVHSLSFSTVYIHHNHMYEDIKKKQRKVKWNKRKERSALAIKKIRHMFLFIHSLWLPGKSPSQFTSLFFYISIPFLIYLYIYTKKHIKSWERIERERKKVLIHLISQTHFNITIINIK